MTRFGKLKLLGLISTLPLVGFLILAFLLFQRIFAGDPQTLPSALIGKPVPEFSLPPLDRRECAGFKHAKICKAASLRLSMSGPHGACHVASSILI